MHLLQTTKYLFVKSDIWKQLQERWLSTKLWPIGPSSALRHREFSKPTKKIKEIKIEWKKKIKLHQKETHSEKKEGNLHQESIKYDLLEVLKNEKIHEPFTTEKEIRDYRKLE